MIRQARGEGGRVTSTSKRDRDLAPMCGKASALRGVGEPQIVARSLFDSLIGNADMITDLLVQTAQRELAEDDGQRRRETFRFLCAVVAAARR